MEYLGVLFVCVCWILEIENELQGPFESFSKWRQARFLISRRDSRAKINWLDFASYLNFCSRN